MTATAQNGSKLAGAAPLRRAGERFFGLPAVARTVQTVLGVAASLRNDPITLRAAALTYLTLLSLVPLLAVVFSIFQAVVGTHELQAKLQEFLIQNLAVGAQENVSRYVTQYIQRATSFGIVGFALLLFSSISLMANVESAMNHTFHAPRPRSLALRFGVYWCILTVGPILLAVSLAATALVQSADLGWLEPFRRVVFVVFPGLTTVTAFTFMYAIVPAVPVRRRAAISGALVAGIAWETAKIAYAWLSGRSVRTGAIYGSLSAIPIFLMWAYLSWIIVLFGARVAYTVHAGFLAHGMPSSETPLGREMLVARVMQRVALSYAHGTPPLSEHAIALVLHAPETEVSSALHLLKRERLVDVLADGGWVPAKTLDRITLADVRDAAREGSTRFSQASELAVLQQLWDEADGAASRSLSATMAELVAAMDSEIRPKAGR